MYYSHSQSGRTRVNRTREGLKTKKTHVQHKSNDLKSIDKLFLHQNELFSSGMDYPEYENYIQGKINNDMFHYKNITEKDVTNLKKRYQNLIKKENDKYSLIGEQKRVSRRQRKIFKEKKSKIIREKKTELIGQLLKEFTRSGSLGVLKNNSHISTDPDNWGNNKLSIFLGGRYLEGHDIKWCNIYSKLVGHNSSLLFDLSSVSELNEYIYNL